MTVKVIKPAPAELLHEQICEHCKCTLQHANEDIYTHYQSDIGGGVTRYYMIHCPNCNYLTDVKVIPHKVKKFPGKIEASFGYLDQG